MGKRVKIGLIFSLNEEWIAGSYYLLNLIHALNHGVKKDLPEITIISSKKSDFEETQKTRYPYLKYRNPYHIKRNLWEAAINRIVKIISGKDFIDKHISDKDIDVLYPASFDSIFKNVTKKLFWIPDFQEHYLTDFFSKEEIEGRIMHQQSLVKNKQPIVFSSENAKADFAKFYPGATCKTFVLNFAVSNTFTDLKTEDVLKKFGIKGTYFIVSNQFWKHKNHQVVLQAVNILSKANVACLIIFTGKDSDYRNPLFPESIRSFIKGNNLESKIKIVGFISREEQMVLMKGSLAIIQPSLFEGWSTVVEDAKALSKPIILSDIAVHREQISNNCTFFNPKDSEQLAEILRRKLDNTAGADEDSYLDYNLNIQRFGREFLSIAKEI